MDPKLAQLLRKLPLNKETVASLLPVVGRYGAQGAVVLARSYLGPVAVEVERRHAEQEARAAAAATCGPPSEAKPPAQQAPAQHGTAATKSSKKTGARKSERAPAKSPPQRAGSSAPPAAADPAHEAKAPDGTAPTQDEKPTDGAAPANTAVALKPAEVALLGMAVTKALFEAGELALHNPRVAGDGKQPEFKLDANGSPPALSLAHVVAAVRVCREASPAPVSDPEAQQPADLASRAAASRAAASPAAVPSAARARLESARAERYAAAPRYTYATPTPNARVPR